MKYTLEATSLAEGANHSRDIKHNLLLLHVGASRARGRSREGGLGLAPRGGHGLLRRDVGWNV